jgi:hypothetical protein
VRRFLSNFAGGWPAFGLLLIRIAAGFALMIDGKPRATFGQALPAFGFGLLEMVDGAVLMAGLWTPVAGILAVILSACEIVLFHDLLCPAILLASMGAGMAFVGPGSLSIDSWLFGFKRIDLEKMQGPPRS